MSARSLLAFAPTLCLLLPGCYLAHGLLGEDPEVFPIDSGTTSIMRSDSGEDARDAGIPPDVDVCEALCDAAASAGCLAGGCYDSCRVRVDRAAAIGCEAEFKGAVWCRIDDPCSRDTEADCVAEHGWPTCLRERG